MKLVKMISILLFIALFINVSLLQRKKPRG